MGCIGSRLSILRAYGHRGQQSMRTNVFQVLNIDDMGRHISPGKLEVTDTDLLLHIRGKPSLTWPLRCLRRYGYENDLFSFESGRRCSTGAGIYAFKCTRAQSLFNLLQARIQVNPASVPTNPSTPLTPQSVNPIAISPTFDYVDIADGNGQKRLQDVTIGSSGISRNSLSDFSSHSRGDNNHPVYMNVDNQRPFPSNLASATHQSIVIGSGNSSAARYSNLCCGSGAVILRSGTGNSASTNSTDHNFNPTSQICLVQNENAKASAVYTNVDCSLRAESEPPPPELNYAELDLQTGRCGESETRKRYEAFFLKKQSRTAKDESKTEHYRLLDKGIPVPLSASARFPGAPENVGGWPKSTTDTNTTAGELGYATIDFDRTAALGIVTRSKVKLDLNHVSHQLEQSCSSRKNRHGSAF